MTANSKILDFLAYDLTPITDDDKAVALTQEVPGYFLESTATINVEDEHLTPDRDLVDKKIAEIAAYLVKCENPQLIISIHGYANKKSDSEERSKKINKFAQSLKLSNSVFIGYRWPSENILKDDRVNSNPPSPETLFKDKLKYAFQALPTMVLGLLISSLVLGIISVSLLLGKAWVSPIISLLAIAIVASVLSFFLTKIAAGQGEEVNHFLPIIPNGLFLVLVAFLLGAIANFTSLLVVLSVIFSLSFGIVLALMLLRLVTYPRDRYRASNYAVLDLVEFIRKLDSEIITKACQQTNCPEDKNIDIEATQKSRVRLSFIAHSLGCEVVTQTVRILSDVFDPESIAVSEKDKNPSRNIGRTFCLERLVLVAPDIPLDSILSGRANFLKPSMRRFREKYIFCNEADLALRLASTAANYFSFPSKSRFRGYKLGNITVAHHQDKQDKAKRLLTEQDYGIVNYKDGVFEAPREYLEIRASNHEHRKLQELSKPKQDRALFERGETVADEFTYFDCTDYVDHRGDPETSNPPNQNPQGVVSNALGKSALILWMDYINLFADNFFKKKIDGHGGYFQGKYSQKIIYEIAFLGFKEFLRFQAQIPPHQMNSEKCQQLLNKPRYSLLAGFCHTCQKKQIQVVVAQKSLEEINL